MMEDHPDCRGMSECMSKKIKIRIVVVLLVLLLIAEYFIVQINRIHGTAFVLINGYDGRLYQICLKLFIALVIAGLMAIGITFFKKQKKIVTGLAVLSGFLLILFMGYQIMQLVNGWDSFHREPYLVSPDGEHALYQDGGDSDIFGNSSGYMHYAMKCEKNGYSRIFYCYEEQFTPQVEWYEDGFLLSYYCPESTQNSKYGFDVTPESDYSQTFRYEKRADGIFFYYE